jgi:hemolysin III
VFSPRIAINASYIVLASFVLLPTWLMLHRQHYFQGKYVAYALLTFITAIFFRIADRWEWLPMGTHFLWHTFGAAACHLMLWYFYTITAVDEGKVTTFANKEVTEDEKLKAS